LASIAALALPGTASAAGASSTYVAGAVAVETQSNKTDNQFRFQIAQTNAAVVNAYNGAYSTTAGCTNCGAAAVSFQIVYATSPNTAIVNAGNEAKAYSTHCVSCNNLAAAYQFVVVDPSAQPSQSERQALANLQSTLKSLKNDGNLANNVDALANEVANTLQGSSPTQRSLTGTTRSVTVNRQVQTG
jgi:hypothetical protein